MPTVSPAADGEVRRPCRIRSRGARPKQAACRRRPCPARRARCCAPCDQPSQAAISAAELGDDRLGHRLRGSAPAGRSAASPPAAPAYRRGGGRRGSRPSRPVPPPCRHRAPSRVGRSCATTPRSCVTNSSAVPCRACISRSAAGSASARSHRAPSSARRRRSASASAAKAEAISTRWRMPPDSSCG